MKYWLLLLPLIGFLLLSSETLSKGGDKMIALTITSPAFEQNGLIPKQHTCDGKDINPPIMIEGIPQAAKSLALVVNDPDAPGGTWVHWVLWNIDPKTKSIKENAVPTGAVQGKNDFRKNSYGGPCPPSGTHRYFFKAYALNTMLTISQGSAKGDLEKAMKGHILAEGQIIGLYKRK
jgi:hypothetical protein